MRGVHRLIIVHVTGLLTQACIEASKVVSARILFWSACVQLPTHDVDSHRGMPVIACMCVHVRMGVRLCKTRRARVHISVQVWSAQHSTCMT